MSENEKLKSEYGYIGELEEKLLLVTNQLEQVNEALLISNEQN